MKNPRSRFAFLRAFTLIELLVVIAIIAILAGLLFPAVNGALDSARKASAKNDVVQIANAVVMYETEYGKLPTNSGTTVGGIFLDALTATTTNNNPRKIVFLEAPNYKRNKGGITNNAYLDPWGNTYNVVMDTGYTNSFSVTAGNSTAAGSAPAETVRKRVGVYNIGSSSGTSGTPTYFRRVVKSWD